MLPNYPQCCPAPNNQSLSAPNNQALPAPNMLALPAPDRRVEEIDEEDNIEMADDDLTSSMQQLSVRR
jgi:hypothetical protein